MTHQVYNGDKPYIFVSYSHRDTARVLPLLEAMMERGYRIWYDQGIEAGSEWADNIARHLKDCFAFVAFTSGSSVKSENCLDEIAFAKSNGKPSLMIFLENGVVLPEGTEMQTARFQRIYYLPDTPVERFIRDIGGASFLDPCREGFVPAVAAKRPAVTEKPRGRKGLLVPIIAAAVILTVILAVAGALALGRGSGSDVPDTGGGVGSASRPSSTEQEAGDTLSDSLSDFTYKLDGHVYALPTPFSELEANDWHPAVAEGQSTSVEGHSFRRTQMHFANGAYPVSITLYNPWGSSVPLTECYVTSITVAYRSSVSFAVAGGLTVESTFEEIFDAHGVPDSTNEDSKGYRNIKYTFPSDLGTNSSVSFRLDTRPETRPGQIPDSEITLYVPHNNFKLETETDPTVPDVVADYVAPTELSDDAFDCIFTDGDAFYQLPCPLSELLKNGWSVKEGELLSDQVEYVPSGTMDSVTLYKGDYTASLGIRNDADYQTIPENCMVYSVFVSRDPELPLDSSFAISSKLNFGSKNARELADALAASADEKTVSTSSTQTSYRLVKRFPAGALTVEIVIDDETDRVYVLDINVA